MGSRLHGSDGRRRRTHNRHSRDGGNPRRGAGDGFPSARERRAAAAHPQSSFPRRRESTGGAGDGFPSARERRAAAGAPTIVGENPRPHNRHSRDGGNPRGGGGDGFPSARERRAAAGAPTIVGENPRTHNRHSREGGNPRRGAGGGWVPVCTGTTGGGGRTHNRRRESTHPQSSFPRRRESTARGAAMGSRLHGNDERRRAHPQSSARIHAPQSSFPRRRESTGGGRRWVPVCTGTTGGDGPPHNRHSHNSGNPRQPQSSFPRRRESTVGAGDGFPSARERRAAAAQPHRHSREWSNARVSLSGNDGARPCGSWSCTRAGRRPSPSRSRRRCWASGRWRSRPPARRRA